MTRRTTALIAVAAAAAVVVAGGIATVAVGGFPSAGGRSASDPSTSLAPTAGVDASRSASEIGRAFLADWVEGAGSEKGRVVRRDQGGDTVSEGQAYGMLVALGVRDEKSFRSIWSWTRDNLQRSDGLLAWRWQDGKIVDDQPASDADLDTARALVLAGKTFDEPAYTKAGTALGSRILDELTASTPDGRILLPGLWAQGTGPWSYNPSYASPATFDQLATATKDPRWRELASGSRAVTTKILQSTALPSDWAQVKADGSVVPLPSPTGTAGTVQYGFDAGRVALRYAESCNAADVALAAKLASPLGTATPLTMQLDLGGTALNKDQSPLAYVARSAARASAGDKDGALRDLRQADVLAQATPTYYGAAWDALGALQLEGDAFWTCSPLKGENS
ncbi:putative endoglucanase [Frondihabitans sp. 762G35]|uniref:glycosyl hydrolase family 8 n=1 Tax=Frondihabitans sp. 762G35 TaxID=1446794 RepID=UPI000D227FD9|nr:glycosyl hydrolase family 8 [Frondihabitans sp. 762G35]ARC56391.1 putative endoglucanase [Frondihabitans sp. 762G35]